MSIDINTIKVGDKVTFEGEQGNVLAIDYDDATITYDVPDPNINGRMNLDVDEPNLVTGWGAA